MKKLQFRTSFLFSVVLSVIFVLFLSTGNIGGQKNTITFATASVVSSAGKNVLLRSVSKHVKLYNKSKAKTDMNQDAANQVASILEIGKGELFVDLRPSFNADDDELTTEISHVSMTNYGNLGSVALVSTPDIEPDSPPDEYIERITEAGISLTISSDIILSISYHDIISGGDLSFCVFQGAVEMMLQYISKGVIDAEKFLPKTLHVVVNDFESDSQESELLITELKNTIFRKLLAIWENSTSSQESKSTNSSGDITKKNMVSSFVNIFDTKIYLTGPTGLNKNEKKKVLAQLVTDIKSRLDSGLPFYDGNEVHDILTQMTANANAPTSTTVTSKPPMHTKFLASSAKTLTKTSAAFLGPTPNGPNMKKSARLKTAPANVASASKVQPTTLAPKDLNYIQAAFLLDQVSKKHLENFKAESKSLLIDLKGFDENFGKNFTSLINKNLNAFEEEANNFYSCPVNGEIITFKKNTLFSSFLNEIESVYKVQLQQLQVAAEEEFRKTLGGAKGTFEYGFVIQKGLKNAASTFLKGVKQLHIKDSPWNAAAEYRSLINTLMEKGNNIIENIKAQGGFIPKQLRRPISVQINWLGENFLEPIRDSSYDPICIRTDNVNFDESGQHYNVENPIIDPDIEEYLTNSKAFNPYDRVLTDHTRKVAKDAFDKKAGEYKTGDDRNMGWTEKLPMDDLRNLQDLVFDYPFPSLVE